MPNSFEDPHFMSANAPCEWCGAEWVDKPELGRGAREMVHTAGCAWWQWFDSQD